MATYNGEKYIKQQIDSILPQLDRDDELVISDDHSADETVKIIRGYSDPRIKIIQNKREKSPVGNFENALNHARGDFIFLADQDDVWLPGKIKLVLNILQNHDLVISDCSLVDQNLNLLADSYFTKYKSGPGFWYNLYKNSYIGSCMAFNRNILDLTLPFPAHIPMHDYWTGMVAEVFGSVFFLSDVLVLHRLHGGNVSATGQTSKNSLFVKIGYRYRIIKALGGLYFRKLMNEI